METDSLVRTITALVARHALTTVAGVLISAGWVDATQKGQFITISTGIVVGAVGVAWSWWQKVGQRKVVEDMARVVARLSWTKVAKANPLPGSNSQPKSD